MEKKINKTNNSNLRTELLKLFKLKSVITLMMVSSLIYGWHNSKVENEQFMQIVVIIITFYFSKNDN